VTIVTFEDNFLPVSNNFDLTEKGIIKVGSNVKEGDLLVSKKISSLYVSSDKGGQVIKVNRHYSLDRIIVEIFIKREI
jgi:DNA-directed RNA polymerase beta subunit